MNDALHSNCVLSSYAAEMCALLDALLISFNVEKDMRLSGKMQLSAGEF